MAKRLIRKIFNQYKLPYISLTPTFSICNEHRIYKRRQFECPVCGKETEVWSRVVGYLRPVKNFHKGKREEYRTRVKYVVPSSEVLAQAQLEEPASAAVAARAAK